MACFQVTHSRTNILELLAHNAPPAGKFLCVQIVEASDSAFVETCCSIAYLRKTCPEVVVICIINDPTLDSAPLMAAGSNGCFSGRFTSAELNLLLTLVVCGDIGLSVVAASRKSHVLDRCPPGASLSDWLVFCGPGHRQENGSFPSS